MPSFAGNRDFRFPRDRLAAAQRLLLAQSRPTRWNALTSAIDPKRTLAAPPVQRSVDLNQTEACGFEARKVAPIVVGAVL